jgi:hypothetical protein
MATFVLIPGAGTDPRVYGATIEALRDLGHDGLVPSLPLGDRDASPSDHADAVAAAVAGETELTSSPSRSVRSPARWWQLGCPWCN